ADEEAAKNSKMSLEAFMALTPQERVDRLAELERSKHDDREKREKDEVASKGAAEREAWRRNSLTPQQRAAEDRERAEAIARAEEEQAAAEKAAAEKEAADKAAAEKEVADKPAADKAAADKEAADKEAAEKAAAEAAKTKTKRKIVREYQARDEAGNPIGRPTHLEADTPEEMYEKLEKAHVEAVKYAERMKKRASITPTPAPTEEPIPVLTEEQLVTLQTDLQSKDEIVKAKAKVALEINEARKEKLQARVERARSLGQQISNTFMRQHPEFYPCDANAQVIGDYIKENNLAWTVENLEHAYEELKHKMAPREGGAPPASEPNAPSPEDVAAAEGAKAPAEAEVAEQERKAAEEAAVRQAAAEKEAKLREDVRKQILAELQAEAEKRIELERAAANPSAAPASGATAAPAAATPPVETRTPAANPPAALPNPPASGAAPGTLTGGRS